MKEAAKYIVLGNVDAGKSSFVSVMCNDILDNGNGSARSLIFKTKQEKETGRTSSHRPYYVTRDETVVTLIDLCGHEKYLKTTIFGLMGMFANYGLMIVGSNQGITKMAVEHFGLLISNRMPFIIVLSKIDICPPQVYEMLKARINKLARTNRKQTIFYETEQESISSDHQFIIDAMGNGETGVIPVICVSNKTGLNMSFVRDLLFAIRVPTEPTVTVSYPAVFFTDHLFSVKGVGKVLSGTLKYGQIDSQQKLHMGPINGKYIPVVAKSLHDCMSQPVSSLGKNKSGSICIRYDKAHLDKYVFRKGIIITECLAFAEANTRWSFEAEIVVFNHPSTITNGYQAVIHCGIVRQTGTFILPEESVMRSNSRASIVIQFMYRPEFVLPGTYFMFRDGRTKGMGRVKYVL